MSNVARFYSEPDFKQPLHTAQASVYELHDLDVPNDAVYVGDTLPDELKRALAQKITELYDSVRPVTVVSDGIEHTFETGFLRGTGEDAELRSATYQSSLSGNFGNGFEVAAAALDDPTKSILYIASMGMGLSGALTSAERAYLRKYGRLLQEKDGVVAPLPVVRALGKLVSDLDLSITSVGSDSAGALMTMAYGAVFGNGAIVSAHQNVRTGLTDKSLLGLAKGMIIDDPKLSAVQAKDSTDALRMSEEKINFVRENISDDYTSKNYKPKKSPAMLWAYANGLGRGPQQGDPLLADNIAFARQNPGVNILFTIGQQDPLAASPNLDARVQSILESTSRYSDAVVSAAVIEGAGHGVQTHNPQFLRALAKAALA